jgi:hypothetical protein
MALGLMLTLPAENQLVAPPLDFHDIEEPNELIVAQIRDQWRAAETGPVLVELTRGQTVPGRASVLPIAHQVENAVAPEKGYPHAFQSGQLLGRLHVLRIGGQRLSYQPNGVLVLVISHVAVGHGEILRHGLRELALTDKHTG